MSIPTVKNLTDSELRALLFNVKRELENRQKEADNRPLKGQISFADILASEMADFSQATMAFYKVKITYVGRQDTTQNYFTLVEAESYGEAESIAKSEIRRFDELYRTLNIQTERLSDEDMALIAENKEIFLK